MRPLPRTFWFLVLLLFVALPSCTTTTQNPFSGAPVIQLPYGTFFVTYMDAATAYAVARYVVTQECLTNVRPAEQCAALKAADDRIMAASDVIKTSIQNPAFPIDWTKVQIFMGEVMKALVQVGVKGATGLPIP